MRKSGDFCHNDGGRSCEAHTWQEVSLQSAHLYKHFCAVDGLGDFFFPVCVCVMHELCKRPHGHLLFSDSSLGPTEGGHSCSGQQTGYERVHDGGGDLPVSHTRHHHVTLVARPGVLRTHRGRVRWTLTSHARTHTHSPLPEISRWRSLFFCLPPAYLPVWTGWSPRL